MDSNLKFISGLLIGYIACKTLAHCKEEKTKREATQKRCECVCKNCYYKRYKKKDDC